MPVASAILRLPCSITPANNFFNGLDMTLKKGDWVRTDTGEEGKVVLVNRVSAFVEMPAEGKDAPLVSYLISRLTKIAPPQTNKNNS